MGDRLEDNQECGRQLQRQLRLFPGRQFERIEGDLLADPLQIVGQVDPGGPENLPHVFKERQRIRVVRGDPADPLAEGEGDLDYVVEVCPKALGAQRAHILVATDGLQAGAGVEHPAAARAQDVPRQFEDAEPRRMQEGGDDILLVEMLPRGESEQVDAAQRAVRRLGHETLDGRDGLRIDRLAQYREQALRLARQGDAGLDIGRRTCAIVSRRRAARAV